MRKPDPEARELLAHALRPFILRRTKAQVAKDLPDKIEQTIYCELDQAQRRLYDDLRDHYRRKLLQKVEREDIKKNQIHILEALLRLRQAAIHPGLIDSSLRDGSSAKLEALLPHLDEVLEEGHKALVFSQFTSMLAILKPRLQKMKIDTFYKGLRLRETCATPEMAESALQKLKTSIDEGRYLDKKKESKDTLAQLGERYLAFCEGKRQKSFKSKKTNVAKILDHFGKETMVCKINMADVEAYQTVLSVTTASRKEAVLKPASINRRMATLKHMLHKATEWGILENNPAIGVKLYKENNRRLRYLTPEECNALLDACPSVTLRQVVTLALNTGMRKGEILNMKWLNVNLRESFIELPDQKSGERGTVPLNQTAVETLRSIPRRLDSEYVFTGKFPAKPFISRL